MILKKFFNLGCSIFIALLFFSSANLVYSQEILQDVFDLLLDSYVVLQKTDNSTVSGKFSKDKPDRIMLISEDGEVLIIMKKDIKTLKKDMIRYKPEVKRESLQAKETELSKPIERPHSKRESEEPEMKKPPLTPEELARKNELIRSYSEKMSTGNSLKNLGNGLTIPGIILDGIGIGALVFGYSGVFDTEETEYVNSGYPYYWSTTTKVKKNTVYSDNFKTLGWVCVGIGFPISITGIILRVTGNNRVAEAEAEKFRADIISCDLIPQMNPKNQSYGLTLQIKY